MRRKTWVSGLGAVVAIGAVLMLLTSFASAAKKGLAQPIVNPERKAREVRSKGEFTLASAEG
jgi:hypothetical protein